MFTGIIEQVGTVKTIERAEEHVNITIETTDWMMTDLVAGGSLSINGACLTVIATSGNTATFNIVYETMRKTSLGHMAEGDLVNLERAMPATGRFNGHIVQGHVDATGSIASIRQLDNIVRKGSICVDGISLTVVDAEDKTFSVAIIPHTWENTSLSSKRAGDPVNIETDVIAKYVERMTESGAYSTTPLVMTGQSGFEGSQSRPFRDDMLRDTQFEMGEASRTYKLMEETGTQTAG
jgi:riboflavin synthase